MSAVQEASSAVVVAGSESGESVYSKEYRRLRKLTSTIEIQRQCVSVWEEDSAEITSDLNHLSTTCRCTHEI